MHLFSQHIGTFALVAILTVSNCIPNSLSYRSENPTVDVVLQAYLSTYILSMCSQHLSQPFPSHLYSQNYRKKKET